MHIMSIYDGWMDDDIHTYTYTYIMIINTCIIGFFLYPSHPLPCIDTQILTERVLQVTSAHSQN